MNKRQRNEQIWIGAAVAILLLAALFRLALLQDVPPGISQDEALDAGMPAYILEGNHALFFAQGYGHEPLYHYWSVPFYLIFGESLLTARLPVVFLGLLLVALTLRWAKAWFGLLAALIAGAGIAISWWPVVFSRVGVRPIMMPVLLVAAAIFWQKRPWLAGLLLGLSFYTYTAARIVLLIPLLHAVLLWLLARRSEDDATRYAVALRGALVIFAVAVAVAAPMQITLWLDPGLQQRVDQLSAPLQALRAGNVGPVLDATLSTLGVFSFTGDPRWTYTLPERPLFDWFTAIFFYGGLLLALWRWRQPKYSLLLIWLGVTLLPSALTPQAPSTVRLVGAIPVVYLLPGLLVRWLFREPFFRKPLAVSREPSIPPAARRPEYGMRNSEYGIRIALLLALLVFNLFRTINDGFNRWPAALQTRMAYQSVLLDVARHWQQAPVENMVVADAFYEPIDAESFRLDLGRNAAARWVQTGSEAAGAIVLPVGGENGRLYVPEFAPIPPDLLQIAGLSPQPAYRSDNRPSFAVYEIPGGSATPPAQIAPISFEDKIELIGYRLTPAEAERPLVLYTFWRVADILPWDLKAFVHLIQDGDPVPVTQHDGFDAAPETLQVGDVVVQRHLLPPFQDLTNASLQVQVGLYTTQNLQRWIHDGEPYDRYILPERILFD